jgi:pimeloyl-ACP methyl ester carboxylesterase
VYDISLVQPFQVGRPYPDRQWAGLTVPTLVLDGGKSPAWMRNGMRALADGIPGAQYRTLPGQTHMVKAPAVTPVVTAFVSASPAARDARSMISGSLARTS